jgi:hypothetical protein
MEPTLTVAGHEAIDRDELLVHDWRVKQLKRLGIPGHLAEGAASHVDWREIARLVRCGCPRCSPSASSANAVMTKLRPGRAAAELRRGPWHMATPNEILPPYGVLKPRPRNCSAACRNPALGSRAGCSRPQMRTHSTPGASAPGSRATSMIMVQETAVIARDVTR